MKTVSFFGHRYFLSSALVEEKIKKLLIEKVPQGYTNFLIGRYGNFDKSALSVCLDVKNNFFSYIEIYIVLCSMSFLKKDELEFSVADEYSYLGCKTLYYDIDNVYFKNRISFSNKKKVDDSDLVICYVDREKRSSGARKALEYAIKQGKDIINLFEE